MKLYTKQEIKETNFYNSIQFIKLTDLLQFLKQKKELTETMNDEKAIYILTMNLLKELK